jgi:hypothetical protein
MNDLPVHRARLKTQFPDLTDEDLEAYEAVTRRILEKKGPKERAKVTRDILETARSAREKAGSGGRLTEAERLALRYLDAVEKMQGRTSKTP